MRYILIMRIEKIKNVDLDSIDMLKLSNHINLDEHKNYYLSSSGKEHYRLLSYLSINNFSENYLDIGTYKGLSALSLSTNKNSKVHTFNIKDELDIDIKPKNINFYIDDILKEEYIDIILSSKLIFLDTLHDGIFERDFINHLSAINYKGALLLDDIHYFYGLKCVWEEINKEKYDITEIGHFSGTGLIYFE